MSDEKIVPLVNDKFVASDQLAMFDADGIAGPGVTLPIALAKVIDLSSKLEEATTALRGYEGLAANRWDEIKALESRLDEYAKIVSQSMPLAALDRVNKELTDERTRYAKLVNDAEDRAIAAESRLDSIRAAMAESMLTCMREERHVGLCETCGQGPDSVAELDDGKCFVMALKRALAVERHEHKYGDDGWCSCGDHALGVGP